MPPKRRNDVNVFVGFSAKVVLGNRLQQIDIYNKHSFSLMLCYNRITYLSHTCQDIIVKIIKETRAVKSIETNQSNSLMIVIGFLLVVVRVKTA